MENQIRKIIREQFTNIFETISRNDVVTDEQSIKTVVDGVRGVGFVSFVKKNTLDFLDMNGVNYIKIPSNPYKTYVIYRDGYEKEARELTDIAEKYDGYLAYYATEKDTRRIGQILEYDPAEVEAFIIKNRKHVGEKNKKNN